MSSKCMKGLVYYSTILQFLSSCVFGPNGKMIFQGEKRTYSFHLPKGYHKARDKNYPLLLLFHGNPSRGWQMARYTGINKTANQEGVIIVYPDATDKRWEYKDQTQVLAEIDYVLYLLDEVQKKFRIDTAQVFAAGMSGGGIFTFNLANQIPEKLAGIAVISGNMPSYLMNDKHKKSLPFIYIHGTEDFLYEGRDTLISALDGLEYWLDRNEIYKSSQSKKLPEISHRDNSSVIKKTYYSSNEAPIIFYQIIGGGHHWPSARFNADKFTRLKLGNFNRDLATNEVILKFFKSLIKP